MKKYLSITKEIIENNTTNYLGFNLIESCEGSKTNLQSHLAQMELETLKREMKMDHLNSLMYLIKMKSLGDHKFYLELVKLEKELEENIDYLIKKCEDLTLESDGLRSSLLLVLAREAK